ncbi:MAG: HDOD domain-containing protein [Solirubrobacterales bacterium]|nr:HDOD domain-containing protein [Solirubrobacterales bacterium]
MASAVTQKSFPAAPARGDGRGRVLATAFLEAERQPALGESRDRALELVARGAPPHDVAEMVEVDVGLTIAVVREAGAIETSSRIRSVADAVERLGFGALESVIREANSYDIMDLADGYALSPDRFRLHSVRVQRAADSIADLIGTDDRDELAAAAILHDIGRPVLARLHPGYAERFDRRAATPDERIAAERRELGIDHALVGGVLARRWGLHARIAETIERHHSAGAEGPAAVLRAADMVAAYSEDCPMSFEALVEAGSSCGLDKPGVRRVLYEVPNGNGAKRRNGGPCPLSNRELDVLRRLAEGKVYKQIARELELSASTVRSHLHNVYGKLGALDRAQAVLIATDRGWI